MVYLLIYLNISCLLIWYDLIIKGKQVRKDAAEVFEENNIDVDDIPKSVLLLLSAFVIVGALLMITPYYIYKTIKRVV